MEIEKEIRTLEDFPYPMGKRIKKIVGSKLPLYRLKVGDYRVIYEIVKREIPILRVIHRKDLEKIIKNLLGR